MRLPRTARISGATVVALTLALLISPAAPANAGTADKKKKVDSSIRSLSDDLEDTSHDLAAAYLRLRKVQAELPGARADLAAAEQRLQRARERDAEVGRQLDVAEAQVSKAQDDLDATTASQKSTDATIGSVARQAYQTGGLGELSVALDAMNADDFVQRIRSVDTAMHVQGQALARLQVARAQIVDKQARLAAVQVQVAALKAQAEAGVVQATQLEQQAAAAKAKVDRLIAQQSAEVRTIAARKAAERKRLDRLQAQQRKLEAQLRAIARAQRARLARAHQSAGSGGPSGGFLSRPVSGGWISSEFGMRYHPILHYWRLHAGMDFAVPCGTPVHAAADGYVVSAGWGGGYGNRVVLNDGMHRGVSLSTTYNHLSRILVHGGQVRRGQLIAYSGTTGESTGCHLHFETYDNGTPVNPRRWL